MTVKPMLLSRTSARVAGAVAGIGLAALIPVIGTAPVLAAAFFLAAAAVTARRWVAARPGRGRLAPAHQGSDDDLTARRRPCPECRAMIPELASRCSYCTSEVEPVLDSFDEMLEAFGD
jgi:hypothetical protein